MTPYRPETIGRFKVERYLGGGGMGDVFLARDPVIDRPVAIKLMRADGTGEPLQLRERFEKEARAVGRLHHQNIVTIFEYGFGDDQEPFIVMQFVDGLTLDAHLERTRPGLADRLALMDGLCAGLHYAHRTGIVHRDIKPRNVMVDTESVVKILDFGIARVTAATTKSGQVVGSINYMSREQLFGESIDHRTDIYSAGTVFYEMLSGRMAFPGEVANGVLHRIMSEPPEPLERLCPDVPAEIIAIIMRCLEKDQTRRYPDLGAVRQALAAARRKIDTEPVGPVRPPAKPTEVPTTPLPGPEIAAEIKRAKENHARLTALVAAARGHLESDRLDLAGVAVSEALALAPGHPDLVALKREVDARIAQRIDEQRAIEKADAAERQARAERDQAERDRAERIRAEQERLDRERVRRELDSPHKPPGISPRVATLVAGSVSVLAVAVWLISSGLSQDGPTPPTALSTAPASSVATTSVPVVLQGAPPPLSSAATTSVPRPPVTAPVTGGVQPGGSGQPAATTTVPATTSISPVVSRASDRIDAGERFLTSGNFAQASSEFAAALQQEPSNARAIAGKSRADAALRKQVADMMQLAHTAFANIEGYCGFVSVGRQVDRILALDQNHVEAKALKSRVDGAQTKLRNDMTAAGRPIPRCDGGRP